MVLQCIVFPYGLVYYTVYMNSFSSYSCVSVGLSLCNTLDIGCDDRLVKKISYAPMLVHLLYNYFYMYHIPYVDGE